jgi:hypothetical protein
MLRAVHKKERRSKASSLCCQSVRAGILPGSPPVAVWVDDEMCGFEAKWAGEAEPFLRSQEWMVNASQSQCAGRQIETGLDLWQP